MWGKRLRTITWRDVLKVLYLTLRRPDRGDISFLKAGPICAEANGSLPLLASKRRLKFTKIPWAVSGLRKLFKYKQTIEDIFNWVSKEIRNRFYFTMFYIWSDKFHNTILTDQMQRQKQSQNKNMYWKRSGPSE